MAVEYTWYGDTDIDTAALRYFVSSLVDGAQQPDGSVLRDGLSISARRVVEDEVNPDAVLFGFDQRFRATFRFANLADAATTEHNTALMVHVLIGFAQRYGGSGVLLFNGEEAVLQYGADGVVFASDWEDWADNVEVAPLLEQFASRVLPQPLL
ncbi:SitI3 family protein [Couchioplanes caeruleus]|uniref:SitI3 family protein n=1 Tax=Couchioplanes caeruleus TaxID=56438 RepID=UPI0020BEF7CF|nr:SitI3 family protein [Couchioplanes caeruleus]UQU64318.1 SitI3 family protein [Couchioplanes caeruleus]